MILTPKLITTQTINRKEKVVQKPLNPEKPLHGLVFGSHHVALPLLLLQNRDLTNGGHAHHHRLDAEQVRQVRRGGGGGV